MTKFMVQLVQLRQVQRTKNTLYSEHANQNSDCLKHQLSNLTFSLPRLSFIVVIYKKLPNLRSLNKLF